MTHFYDLASRRRSIRRFTGERLSEENLSALIGTVLMSPSSKGKCPWQFIVVDEASLLADLSRCKEHGAAMLADCAAAVVVVADPSVSDVWIEDASVATTYLLLQAEDSGLGACWVQIRERQSPDGGTAEEVVRRLLHIPAHLRVLSVVALGHKAQERSPFSADKLQWNKVHLNAYPQTEPEE